MDYYNIGAAPWSEPCAQVGQADYREQAGKECRAFIRQIRRVIGPEPPGATLIIKSFPHDFGSYFEVCCRYRRNSQRRKNTPSVPTVIRSLKRGMSRPGANWACPFPPQSRLNPETFRLQSPVTHLSCRAFFMPA